MAVPMAAIGARARDSSLRGALGHTIARTQTCDCPKLADIRGLGDCIRTSEFDRLDDL